MDYGEEQYDETQQEDDYSPNNMEGRGDMGMNENEMGEQMMGEYDDQEGESPDGEDMMMGEEDDYGEESAKQSNANPYPKQNPNAGLEQRLEQIKNNIKTQKNETLGQSNQSLNSKEQSIDRLEDVLKAQREKLDSIQNSQGYRNTKAIHSQSQYRTGDSQTPNQFNGQQSKEMIEFDLSEASPIRKSQHSYGTGKFSQASGKYGEIPGNSALRNSNKRHLAASSSVNLEKAYEELEKEIMEIKSKLQHSIN